MPSLPPQLRAFVRPFGTFREWTPSLGVALLLVLVAGGANAYAVAQTADVVGGHVSGTTVVDNPARPPEAICDDDFGEIGSDVDRRCDRPKTIEKKLGPVAADAVSGGVPLALLTPFVTWILVTVVFALLTADGGLRDGEQFEQFVGLLPATAWGVAPATLRYLARPVAVSRLVEEWSYPSDVELLSEAARTVSAGTDSTVFLAVLAATLAWQGYVFAGALRGVRDASRERAVGVAAVLAALAFGFAAVGAVSFPPDAPNEILGLLGVAVGFVAFALARTFVAIDTFFELIGMRGRKNVEPRDWYLWLRRAMGALVMVAGFVLSGGVRYL
ncbi:hypothetical protein [Halomicrococcus sp. SG-WS-1]|uniref:hypothetical protein n=1 Tax=Halomicrococcus sp. SG-WS-1 TaxID=3439057 RepID=UPI003F7B0BBB